MFISHRLLILFCLGITLVIVGSVSAQADPKMAEFISADGMLSLSYPADWYIQELPVDEGQLDGVTITSSQDTDPELELEPGQRAISVSLHPLELLSSFNMERATVKQIVEIFAGSLGNKASSPRLGTSGVFELAGCVDIGYMTYTYPHSEGVVLGYVVNDIFASILVDVYPGEFSKTVKGLALEIASSLKYTDAAGQTILEVDCEKGSIDIAAKPGYWEGDVQSDWEGGLNFRIGNDGNVRDLVLRAPVFDEKNPVCETEWPRGFTVETDGSYEAVLKKSGATGLSVEGTLESDTVMTGSIFGVCNNQMVLFGVQFEAEWVRP